MIRQLLQRQLIQHFGLCFLSLLLLVSVQCQTDTLNVGSALYSGQYLTTVDGYYKLIYESSGIITGYSVSDSKTFWQSNGPSASRKAGYFILQTDCNLVAYDNANKYYWATMTTPCSARVPYKLQILNTRDIVLYDSIGSIVWHSNSTATAHPSQRPSSRVPTTSNPTFLPSDRRPSKFPTSATSTMPKNAPPVALPPYYLTILPTPCPSVVPSSIQTSSPPTNFPTFTLSTSPTLLPTPIGPTNLTPASLPTEIPTITIPIVISTIKPSAIPSLVSSAAPSPSPIVPAIDFTTLQPSESTSLPPSQVTVRPVVPLASSTYPTSIPTNSTVTEPPTIQITTTSIPSFESTISGSTSRSTEFPTFSPTAEPSSSTEFETPSESLTTEPFSSLSPTTQPSLVSSEPPLSEPSSRPSIEPTLQPTILLSAVSVLPTVWPTIEPLSIPTESPSSEPSYPPSLSPTATVLPSVLATAMPSLLPTLIPNMEPSHVSTGCPSSEPSSPPVMVPTNKPFDLPTTGPSLLPSLRPTVLTNPTGRPSSEQPTPSSVSPTDMWPYMPRTFDPTIKPSQGRTRRPSSKPTSSPSLAQTAFTKLSPTNRPSEIGRFPSCHPTSNPNMFPPSHNPSDLPSLSLDASPSFSPSAETPLISNERTLTPSLIRRSPTDGPADSPSVRPSNSDDKRPSDTPSVSRTSPPSRLPSRLPSSRSCPTFGTTFPPSIQETGTPSRSPSVNLANTPSMDPSSEARFPSIIPTTAPSKQPTGLPSEISTVGPSSIPSPRPSARPIATPTEHPSMLPISSLPTCIPTTISTSFSSFESTAVYPSSSSTELPTMFPTLMPHTAPSSRSSSTPIESSFFPSVPYSTIPTTKPITSTSLLTQSPSQFPTSESPSSFYPTATHTTPPKFPTFLSTELPTITIDSIKLFSDDHLNGFNTKQRLLLTAHVLTSTGCTTNWTISDSSVSLSTLSFVPTQQYIFRGRISTVQLYLPGGLFSPGKKLLFSFQCGSLFASITVTTNMPPSGGTFNVNPSIGYELSTSFLFSASDWFDSDLPLQYLFGYADPSTRKQLSICAGSAAQTSASYLPSGRSVSKYVLNTTLVVSDSLASSTTLYFPTIVRPSSIAAIRTNASNKLSLNMINVLGSFLNQANCTGVSNCSKLNRLDCSNVDFTCGDCVPGYIGESGSHNSLCWRSSKRLDTKIFTFCRTDSDCGAFENCQKQSGTCFIPSKECVHSCSFKGNCSYVSRYFGYPVPECKVSSSDCDAVCSCDAGYAGSSCSFTSEELSSRISLRHDILQGIDAIVKGGNRSAGFVVSMGSTLSSVTEKVDELSSDSVNVTLAIMQSLLSSAADTGVGYFDLLDLLSAGDFAAGATANGTHSSQIVQAVNLYNSIVAQQILPSQDSVVNILNNFRTATSIISTGKGSTTNISIPQSPIEELVSSYRGGVTFAQNVSNSAPFTVSLTESSASLFHSLRPIVSNALTIHVSNLQALSQSNATLTSNSYDFFINLKYTPLPEISPDASFTTHCTHQMSKTKVIQKYVCKLGSTVLIHNCTNKVGTQTSFCPVYRPSCQSFPVAGDNIGIGTMCRTVSYTAEYILCLCTVSSTSKISRRSLSNTDTNVVAVTLQVATVSKLVASTFKDTFTSPDDLNSPQSVQKAFIAILMFCSVWLFGMVLTLACNWRRNKMKTKNKELFTDLRDEERNEAGKSNGIEQVRGYLVGYILEAFPSVFRERSRVQLVIQEIRKHHKYLSLFLSSETGDRADTLRLIKVAQLLTIQTMLMFLIALFYGLQSPPDDGTCRGRTTEQTCLARKSVFDTSQTYCEWILVDDRLPSHNGYICGYREPVFTAQMVLVIAVLVSVITAICIRPIEYLFKLLAAPTADSRRAAAAFIELQRNATNAVRRASQYKAMPRNTVSRQLSKRLIVGEETILFPNSMERAQVLAHASIKTITMRAAVMIHSQEQDAASAKSQLVRERNAVNSALVPSNNPSVEWDEKSNSDDGNDPAEEAEEAVQHDVESRLATIVHQQSTTASAPLSVTERMDQLTEDVTLQRKLLPYSEVEEYDRQWGLDPTGDFTRGDRTSCCGSTKPSQGVQEAILHEMEAVKKLAGDKVEQLKIASDEHTGFEILHLFVLDLLGRDTPAAIIFEQKADEDFKRTKFVTEFTKNCTVLILGGLNMFFAYYAVLFGYEQGSGWQQSYIIAYIAQMFVEIFINETLEVIWLNVCLPTLVTEEVCAVSSSLIDRVKMLCEDGRSADSIARRRLVNVPDYLFVSTSVAKAYPKLMESIIVQTYTTHLPGELAKKWNIGYMRRLQSSLQHVNRQRFVSLATILAVGFSGIRYLATAPIMLQRMLVRAAQPVFVSGIVMAFYAVIDSTVNIAVFLACFAVMVGYFVFLYMRGDSASRSKVLVQPMREPEGGIEVAREPENIVQEEDLVHEDNNADVSSFHARSDSCYDSVSPPISEGGGDDSGSSYCYLSDSRGRTNQPRELIDLDMSEIHVRDRFDSEGSDMYEVDSNDLSHVSEP